MGPRGASSSSVGRGGLEVPPGPGLPARLPGCPTPESPDPGLDRIFQKISPTAPGAPDSLPVHHARNGSPDPGSPLPAVLDPIRTARLPAAPRSRAMPGTAMDQHEQPRFPTLKIEGSQARAARRVPAHAGLALWRPVSALILLAFVLAPDARAIPSPDVVISLFASAAQVLGVATVILGRWFFVRRGPGLGTVRAKGSSFTVPFFVSAGLLVATLAGWGLYYLHVQDVRM